MKLTDFIVQIYCDVDDFMKQCYPKRALRHRGPLPQLSDSEVLTMEIVGEFLGLDQDQKIFAYFRRHFQNWFPHLSCRVTFLRQATGLWKVKEQLFETLASRFVDTIIVLDSLPIPACRFVRANHSKRFKGLAAYGKDQGQTFYGFRLHLKINSIGMIQAFDLTAANVADIRMVPELTAQDQGLLLADRAYWSEPLREQLLQTQGLAMSIPAKYGKYTPEPAMGLRRSKQIRRLVETVGSQLTCWLQIKTVWARDLWHLTNRILRKILAHTFSVIYCLQNHLKPLRLSQLIAA